MATREIEVREKINPHDGIKAACHFPENHIDNETFAAQFEQLGAKTSNGNPITTEGIFKATGIKLRHFVHPLNKIPTVENSNAIRIEQLSDMAEKAARDVLSQNMWDQVDFLISSTSTPYNRKSLSKALKNRLSWWQIDNCGDVIAECASFVFALEYLKENEEAFNGKRVLYTAAEYISPYGNPTDLDRTLLCDGAAALAFVPGEDLEILSVKTKIFPELSGLIKGPIQRELCDEEVLLKFVGINPSDDVEGYETMDGRAVFLWAVNEKTLPPLINLVAEEVGEVPRLMIPHQANGRITEALKKYVLPKVGMKDVFVYDNIEKIGNCGSVTIPNAFGEVINRGWEENGQTQRLQRGDVVLLVGFGAGMSAAVAGVRILK